MGNIPFLESKAESDRRHLQQVQERRSQWSKQRLPSYGHSPKTIQALQQTEVAPIKQAKPRVKNEAIARKTPDRSAYWRQCFENFVAAFEALKMERGDRYLPAMTVLQKAGLSSGYLFSDAGYPKQARAMLEEFNSQFPCLFRRGYYSQSQEVKDAIATAFNELVSEGARLSKQVVLDRAGIPCDRIRHGTENNSFIRGLLSQHRRETRGARAYATGE
jgi:hypothetical protein